MSSLARELFFIVHQFLEEEKHKETVHKLEQESGFYFNMKHFEEVVMAGEWGEVESYLTGFTKVDDNRYSMKIFFEIRKQKYLEALDKRDRAKAVDILVNDLKVFSNFNEELFKEMTQLLTLENFRENEQLSKYGDTNSARKLMLSELKKLIEANPMFREKLQYPNLKGSRLRTLINQSLNWQHQLCKNPRANPDIKTLFYDHSCSQPNGAQLTLPAPQLMNMMPKPGGFPQIGQHGTFQPTPSSLASMNMSGWMTNSSNAVAAPTPILHHQAVSGAPLALAVSPHTAPALRRPITPTNSNPAVDYHSTDSEHSLKRQRPLGISDEVAVATSHIPAYPSIIRIPYSTEELPKKVAVVLEQGSLVMSMDFHPLQPTVILVGTNVGDVAVWEVSCKERLAYATFKVWNLQACSMCLQCVLMHDKDPAISVNRVLWNPEGSRFGVAFSKNLVHLYDYNGRFDLVRHLEIDAHAGGVNDIAFSQPNNKLCIITCGDDKTIKVWDAVTGAIQYTFEGHETPVYSICPHSKDTIQFIFSTSTDGKIKAWLYDNAGSRVDYTAPGHWCTTMAYSADGTRLFSCGTSKDGDSYIVEWNESEGTVKRSYSGFRKRSIGVVQFDTTKNRFLAAGDEFMIKFWDMDNNNLLTAIDAEGGLPASPRIRFNKFGSLLAVSTNDSCIKILANSDGFQLLRILENRTKTAISSLGSVSAPAGTSASGADRGAPLASTIGLDGPLLNLQQNGDNQSLGDVKPMALDESIEKSKIWKLGEIREPSQCCTLKLPDSLLAVKVSRLIYTSSGSALLALTCNAVHKLWKWQKTDRNKNGKATVLVPPVLWQPSSCILMTNELSDANPEEVVHCFALSKNDSYVMSTSGEKISLFNMMTFKTMTTFMQSPPAATSLAFHPEDNNIIAIGMDDSSIQIYNVRTDEVNSKLIGHQKSVTGLAFSSALHVLVSSGADAQLCLWRMDGWEKQASKLLQIPSAQASFSNAETRVEFHHHQIHFLVVHETQLAIYDATKLECLKQWSMRERSITHATFSGDTKMIYASFKDGSVGVFTSTLQLRCQISPTAYLNSQPSSNVYPVVVAANPVEPNQFALGLTDGSVQIMEPSESEGKWGSEPPAENGVRGGANVAAAGSSQPLGNPASSSS